MEGETIERERKKQDDSFELSAADARTGSGEVCVCMRVTVETLRNVILKSRHSVKCF